MEYKFFSPFQQKIVHHGYQEKISLDKAQDFEE